MEPLQLLHFADTHIGIENYGRIDTATGQHTRLQDFLRCLEFVVETALEREIDAVLFAGDAYKHANPNPTHEGKFAEQLKRLTDVEIPVVMVTGNHDIPASFGKASALHIFTTLGDQRYFLVAERPELFRIETKRGPFQVACFPWPTRHILLTKDEYKNLSDQEITRTIETKCSNRLDKFARDLDPDIPSVLLAHLAAASASYSGTERTTIIGQDPVILDSVLKNPAFDYVALGHIHKHQDLNAKGRPHVVYPGSPSRIDFGEARDDKGVCLVSLVKNNGMQETRYEFLPTPARRFLKIDLDVRSEDFPTEALLRKLQTYDTQDAVVRVSYLVDEGQKSLVDEPKLYAALADAFLIAGMTQKTETEQQRRPRLPEGLNMIDTLGKYLDYRPELSEQAEDLKHYAQKLLKELES